MHAALYAHQLQYIPMDFTPNNPRSTRASFPSSPSYHIHGGHRYGQGDGGLDAGQAHIWLCALSGHFNIDAFTMAEAKFVSTAHGGTPATIPDLLLSDTDTSSTSTGEVSEVTNADCMSVGESTTCYVGGIGPWNVSLETLE